MAFVKPRAIRPESGEVLPLVDLVASYLDTHVRTIRLKGDGKSTALADLSARSGDRHRLNLVDDASSLDGVDRHDLTVFHSRHPLNADVELTLAPWTLDDIIEYVIAKAPDRCQSVMARLTAAKDFWFAGQSPTIISMLLDLMIDHDELNGFEDAIRYRLANLDLTDQIARTQVIDICQRCAFDSEGIASSLLGELRQVSLTRADLKFLSHYSVGYLLAVDAIALHLAQGSLPESYMCPWPVEVLDLVGQKLVEVPCSATIQFLDDLAHQDATALAGNAAGVLFRFNRKWRPRDPTTGTFCFDNAQLEGVNWSGVILRSSNLRAAQLSHADFCTALLTDSNARDSDFSESLFFGANMDRFKAKNANLFGAVLEHVSAQSANFAFADLRNASLERGNFCGSLFNGADLRGANLNRSLLEFSTLRGGSLDDATFVGANLFAAVLDGIDLRSVDFSNASLAHASLVDCNLEAMAFIRTGFSNTRFINALLTGSRLLECDLLEADLTNAKLADVSWNHCDLRGARFIGCHFHYGSTRCGLVDSPYPSHGTRTGFYTDEATEQYFKRPEEIRKADLRGCDFRGADVVTTDFYLVDLRDAKYDRYQEMHFRRCGAILEDYGQR